MASESRTSVLYSQNFLKSRKLARRLVERSGISEADTVVEVGPGTGMLTSPLASRCRHVIAVEKDPALARELIDRLDGHDNVTIFGDDVLQLPLPLTPYKVFANIPFNVTSDIVRKFTRTENPPEEMFLVMQREAAQRFTGSPVSTMFSVLLFPWFEMSIDHVFRTTDFVPPPRVEVVMLRFSKRGPPLVGRTNAKAFRDFVVYGFTAWRSNIGDVVQPLTGARGGTALLTRLGIDPRAKPRDVSASDWLELFRAVMASDGREKALKLTAGAEERLVRQQQGLSKPSRSRSAAAQRRSGRR